MVIHEEPTDARRDDEDVPDVEVPGDDPLTGADAATDASFDEQADRAQAAIDRAHETEKAELEPDDASVAAQAASARPGPDADERPV